MLARHIIGYLPALIVPALAAFAGIFCFTRLLTPHEYGIYILLLNGMGFVNIICFYWLQVSLPRLMPQAMDEVNRRALFSTAVIAFAAIAALLALAAWLFSLWLPGSSIARMGRLCYRTCNAACVVHAAPDGASQHAELPALQPARMRAGSFKPHLRPFLGVYTMHAGALGIIGGMMAGLLCILVLEGRSLLQVSWRYFSRSWCMELLRFGLPLVVTYGFVFILSTSDRFLIEHFYGASQVGQYAAGYSLVDRIITHVFMIVTIPSFPLAIYALETGGIDTARKQTHANGIAILLLTLPACAGLMLASPALAAMLLGQEFRATAMQVMPWIALASLLNGLATHYFDHVFHLAKKPYLLLLTQGPAAGGEYPAESVSLAALWIHRGGRSHARCLCVTARA